MYTVLSSFQQIVGDSSVPGAKLLPSCIWERETLKPTKKLKSNCDGNQAASPQSDHFP